MIKKSKNINEKEEREIVNIDVNDLLERAKEIIMAGHGGLDASEIEYIGELKDLKFSIPKKDRAGKCNELCEPDEEGGCGATGGCCICGLPKGHKGNCECELCGYDW